jgi:ABC-type uncharacterized transport system involved in gliding motility auxiliary subunit
MAAITLAESVSIPANSTNPNVVANTKIENIPNDGLYQVELYATGSASGLRHQVDADTDIAVQESALGAGNVQVQATSPEQSEYFIDSFVVTGGSKLFVEVTNTTAGALTYFYAVRLTPLS